MEFLLFSLGNHDSSLCQMISLFQLPTLFCVIQWEIMTERPTALRSALDLGSFSIKGHHFIMPITIHTSPLAMFAWFSDTVEGKAIYSFFGIFMLNRVVCDYHSHQVKNWVTCHYFPHCGALMQISPLNPAPETVIGAVWTRTRLWSKTWVWVLARCLSAVSSLASHPSFAFLIC